MDTETLPFQCNLGYQVPRKKKGDYIGKQTLEKARQQMEAGKPPFKNVLVGMTLGGKPIEDYAPDFWLISGADGGEPVGYVTSPWYSPELGTNIAMGYVPWQMRDIGTALRVHLPDAYAETPGVAVAAEVVEVPLRPSVNPSAREVAKVAGRDAAF
jgi:aminomethyltransferase